MIRILVTGGAGFIGSNLCKTLVKNEENYVICVDNLLSGRIENLKDLNNQNNFEFCNIDITEKFDIPVDQIYNAACPASPKIYSKHSLKTFETIVEGTKNLLELARKYNATFLQFSTSEVYGNPMVHPQTEKYYGNVNTIGTRSCYDEGKRAAETLCYLFNKEYNVKTKIVRIFNTYGINMREDDGRVIPNFITHALKNEDIEIYGDGTQTRSLCYIDDMIEGLINLMNTDASITGPINLGNDCEITMNELAKKIIELTNSQSKIVYKELLQDDPIRRKPDLTLAKELLNYNPKVSLETGLSKSIQFYKNIIESK